MEFYAFFVLIFVLLFALAGALPAVQEDIETIKTIITNTPKDLFESELQKTPPPNGSKVGAGDLRIVEGRGNIQGVAACEKSSSKTQCALISNWNDMTDLDSLYLLNNNCDVIGYAYHVDTKAPLPYPFTSQLPYVVVVTQWSPTGLPEFLYKGGYYGWLHGFYEQFMLDDVYSHVAYFGC